MTPTTGQQRAQQLVQETRERAAKSQGWCAGCEAKDGVHFCESFNQRLCVECWGRIYDTLGVHGMEIGFWGKALQAAGKAGRK